MTPQAKGIAYSLTAAFWFAAFLIMLRAAREAPREVVVLAFLLVAAVSSSALNLFARRERRRRLDRLSVLVALSIAALTVIGNLAIAESLVRVEPAVTAVVLQSQVLFVPTIGALFIGERITARLLIGAAVALGGFAVMQSPWSGTSVADLAGASWAVLAALCFAVILLITRQVADRIDPVSVNALRLWIAVAALVAIPGNAAALGSLDWHIWALAAGCGLCGPALSRLMLMYAVRHISASHTKLVTLISPVFALLLGLAIFQTLPAGRELLGGAILLLGVALPLLELVRSAPEQRQAAGDVP